MSRSFYLQNLDFLPLHRTTKGCDIFKAVNQTLEKFGTDFSRCSAIVTEGARAMIRSKNRFADQIKQRDLKFPIIHCIIHQEALCGKVVKLCSTMQTVTKIINSIKGGQKFLLYRKFQHFLEEHNAVYIDIPLYCEVRWLSAGKCLKKFFAIRKEIFLFLQDMPDTKFDEFKFFFEDSDSLCGLALLTNLTNHLNNLNLKLQKTNQTISQLVSHIDSFRRKLLLFKNHIENNVTPGFQFSLFWKEGIWDRKGMEGRFRCLSRRSTCYDVSRESNTLVSSPRCESAYHMVAVTPSGTVCPSVL